MNLADIIPTAEALLKAVPELAEIPMFVEAFTGPKLECTLKDHGRALVLSLEDGVPENPNSPVLNLINLLVVTVLENQETNTDNEPALAIVSRVFEALHAKNVSGPGWNNELMVDNKAYTKGELGTGLVTYFCNFVIKTSE